MPLNNSYIRVALLLLAPTAVFGFTSSSFPHSKPSSLSPSLLVWSPSPSSSTTPVSRSPLFHSRNSNNEDLSQSLSSRKKSLFKKLLHRRNTLELAGIHNAKLAGSADGKSGLFGTLKKAHNPKTYLALALIAAIRWESLWKNLFYWFAVGFCVKWYRARYVFKIPVWDRQPNWNNVITSKEQEKDLKAYTCKKCGSTIFIAKTREFFFEGSTGTLLKVI